MTDLPGREVGLPVAFEVWGRRQSGWLYGRRCGRPDNPLKLLLLHGVGLTWMTWRRLLARLGERADVVALDLLGFGRSRAAGSDVGVAGQTQAVRAALDQLGWRRVVLGGHSMGGGIALGVALWEPRRVAGLALVGSIGFPQPVPPLFRTLFCPGMPLALAAGARLAVALGLVGPAARRYGFDPLATRDFLTALGGRRQSRTFAAAVRALRPSLYLRYARLYPTIACPTLILHGERDHIVPPEVARRLHAALPDSRLVWLPASHMPQETHPRAVAEALGRFFDERFAQPPEETP